MEQIVYSIPISRIDTKRGFKVPDKLNKELAEFLGILTGDGYMNYYPDQYKYILEISGDSRYDYHYFANYVSPLIEELFHIRPTIFFRNDENSVTLRIISKGMFHLLTSVGFKRGKKQQIGVPKWILRNEEFLYAFMQGLIDTDFSLVLLDRKQKKYPLYPRIAVGLKSKKLIKIIDAWFISKGFKTTVSYDQVRKDKRGFITKIHTIHINGRKELEKWMRYIGFRNRKHILRYEFYKKMVGQAGFEPAIQVGKPKLDQSPTSSA